MIPRPARILRRSVRPFVRSAAIDTQWKLGDRLCNERVTRYLVQRSERDVGFARFKRTQVLVPGNVDLKLESDSGILLAKSRDKTGPKPLLGLRVS